NQGNSTHEGVSLTDKSTVNNFIKLPYTTASQNETLKVKDRRLTQIEQFAKNKVRSNGCKIDYGVLFVIKNTVCWCRRDKTYPTYQLLKKYLNMRLDVVNYLKTLDKFDKLRMLMLNEYQNISFDFMKPVNIANESELDNLKTKMNKN